MLSPRKDLPPLLLKLTERRAEKLDYLGVSYGLTSQLLRHVLHTSQVWPGDLQRFTLRAVAAINHKLYSTSYCCILGILFDCFDFIFFPLVAFSKLGVLLVICVFVAVCTVYLS